jgi:N6-adenosine-specific RNA methylase IME4
MSAPDEKAARRAERERFLAAKIRKLPDRRYGVIVADPEWRFEAYNQTTGLQKAADNHYPTSPIEVILARDVPSIAAPDCTLFLWATVPCLEQALRVVDRWGFFYKSMLTWDKVNIGTGFWLRNRTEHLLIATKGSPPAPAMGTQIGSLWTEKKGVHSAKPVGILDWIERLYPNMPKIELNRRGAPRPGWDAWGNEVETPHDGTVAMGGNETETKENE